METSPEQESGSSQNLELMKVRELYQPHVRIKNKYDYYS